MGKYRILGPVSYMQGGKAVVHKKPADVVQIDDGVAAKLGNKVKRLDAAEPPPRPKAAKGDEA